VRVFLRKEFSREYWTTVHCLERYISYEMTPIQATQIIIQINTIHQFFSLLICTENKSTHIVTNQVILTIKNIIAVGIKTNITYANCEVVDSLESNGIANSAEVGQIISDALIKKIAIPRILEKIQYLCLS
jgi:hypothetical protein